MKRLLLLLILFPGILGATLIQYPAFTPDNDIIFTHQGDIWQLPDNALRGERITAHINLESEGLISPDGGQLAFVTDRHGDEELYLLNLADNTTRRMTWTDTRKHICFWHDDKLYATEKATGLYPRRYRLYSFDPRNEEQTLIIDDDCGAADISPDGKTIAYTRRPVRWTRKHYRGSGNNDLFLYHIGSGRFERLTDSPWSEAWGLFAADGRSLYFVSDEDSTRNLFRLDLASGQQQQLTHFREDGVLFPRMNGERTEIVFTRFGQLHVYDLSAGSSSLLEPQLAASPTFNTQTLKAVDGNAESYAVSPDQKWVVAAVRGDLFLTRRDDERTIQLTGGNWHHSRPVFSPGGDTLYFLSDRGGLTGVWQLTHPDTTLSLAEDYHRDISAVTNLDQVVNEFVLSPGGIRMALTCGHNRIVLHDLVTRSSHTLLSGYQPGNLAWHGDGNWLLYQNENGEFNQDIFLVDVRAENPQPLNISSHPKNDYSGALSPNGFWVAWVNEVREERQPQIATLTRRVWEMSKEETNDALEDDSTATPLQIDIEGLFDRVTPLDHPAGQVSRILFSPDSKQVAYVLRLDHHDYLYRADWNGEEEQEIASGSHLTGLQWFAKGNRIYYRDGGRIKYVGVEGGKSKSVAFRGEQVIDQLALQEQKFRTLWQRMNDWFYDPAFHGVNWNSMYHKYHDLAVSQLLDADFNTVAEMMLGELNSSHQGVSGGQNRVEGDAAAFLGVTLGPTRSGLGSRVIDLQPQGPADLGEAGLLPGDIILEIDHIPLAPHYPPQALLLGKQGEQLPLLVERNHTEIVLQVTPCSGWRYDQLGYRSWVAANRTIVDEMSQGRAAYVHIAGMNWRSTVHFERELFARTQGREALIIDVRNNGGGYTTDYLLTMLNYQPHAYTIGRDGERGYPQGRIPFYYWHRPVVVICNENSFSNAEIFTHAVKTLGRARVVGTPTFGGVISTGGFSLEDGTRVREPFRGWYSVGSGLNLENNGCQPHVEVELSPADIREGRDPQLETAIREALLQLQ